MREIFQHTYKFKVRKLADSINNLKCGVEVKDVGDNILFVGLNSCFSISARDFRFLGYKGNCIYFTDDSEEVCSGKRDNQQDSDIGVFDLANGRIESLPGFKCHPRFFWPHQFE